MNLVTVIIYWSVLHKSQLKKYKGDTIRTMHQYWIHIFPALGIVVNFYFTDVRMCKEHYQAILVMCVAYSFTNFFAVRVLGGEPLYWFLDWKDIKSPLIIFMITATFTMAYVKMAELSYCYKPAPNTP